MTTDWTDIHSTEPTPQEPRENSGTATPAGVGLEAVAMIARLRQISHAIADGNRSELTMRVPAEPDRDADLVVMKAADTIAALTRERDDWATVAESAKVRAQIMSDQIAALQAEAKTVRELCRCVQYDREKLQAELAKRAKQIGVACLKHDLTHSLVCGHCYAELQAENAELRKDAERYRWLRDAEGGQDEIAGDIVCTMAPEDWDAAIDAAREGK